MSLYAKKLQFYRRGGTVKKFFENNFFPIDLMLK